MEQSIEGNGNVSPQHIYLMHNTTQLQLESSETNNVPLIKRADINEDGSGI